MSKILAFAASTRRDSFNKALVRAAADMAQAAGAEVTTVDLADYRMPLYDGDLEASDGGPEAADRLFALTCAHDGMLLSCPEYNGSVTAVFKNTIDWLSRPREGEAPLAAFTGKTAALLATSPGALGGLRGLVHARAILGNIGVLVLPGQGAVPSAHDAFDADGGFNDARTEKRVRSVVDALVAATDRLSGPGSGSE